MIHYHPLAPAAETEAARRVLLAQDLPRRALDALDAISRPMTPREIEKALRGIVSKSQLPAIATALRGLSIIMIKREEDARP